MENRIDDAEYEIKIPLCKSCKNMVLSEFDPKNPLKPLMSCDALGAIPDGLLKVREMDCNKYNKNPQEAEKFKSML